MRCPILSVDRLVRKEVVVVMENERRCKSYKKNREIPLHEYNGVYHVHESELSESCPLEDPSNVDEPPAVTVRETTMPWTRRFLHKYTEDERMLQPVGATAIPGFVNERDCVGQEHWYPGLLGSPRSHDQV